MRAEPGVAMRNEVQLVAVVILHRFFYEFPALDSELDSEY